MKGSSVSVGNTRSIRKKKQNKGVIKYRRLIRGLSRLFS